jgi:hypothetical protein
METKPTGRGKALTKQTEIYLQTVGWKQNIRELKHLKDHPDLFLNFFDWRLDFPEVMNQQVVENVGFDIVIGNPPYIKVQSIPKELIEFFKTRFKSATGKYDIYVIFMEISFHLLKKNGCASFINPHRFLITDYGKGLRKLIFEKKALNKLVYFGVEQIFETATTYTGIFFIKENSSHFKFAVAKDKELNNLCYFSKSYLLPTFNFSIENNDDQIITKIIKYQKVSDIFDGVFQGLIPMGDDIQVLEGKIVGKYFQGFSKALNKEISIEANVVKPLLKGENIKRYLQPQTNLFIFFPHYTDEKGKTKAFTENELKLEYPLAYEYISNFKKELIDKKIKYKTNPTAWYSLHRSREQYIFESPKLITPQLQNHSSFTYDDNSFYADAGGYMILSSKKNSTSLKCYLGLFNSKLFYYFIKKTSTPYNNNYFYFKTNYIEPFSIPITLQLNNDIFEKIVDEILTAKKVNPESDTTALEQQIDNMVYKLYELTYQEVKIIDPEFALTEKEYADIKLATV